MSYVELNVDNGPMLVQYCKPMSFINLMCRKYASIGPLQACLLGVTPQVVIVTI